MSPEPLERAIPSVDVLGVSVSAISMEQALDAESGGDHGAELLRAQADQEWRVRD